MRERRDIYLIYLYALLAGLFSLTLPLGVQAIVGLVSGGLILQPVVLLIGFVVAGTLAAGLLQVMQLSVVETIQQRVFARMALDFSFRLPRIRYDAAVRTCELRLHPAPGLDSRDLPVPRERLDTEAQ